MRHLSAALIVAFLALVDSHAQVAKQDPDRVPVIATSGHVEIASIRVAREKVSRASKEADLTNLQIELWLTRDAESNKPSDYLVKLLELAPVEDNTGKLLSTKSRVSAIEYLQDEVAARQINVVRPKEGPVIAITLEVPARTATSIKSLKGKALLSRCTYVCLQFDNLAAINGKVLDHPKLKELPIRSSIKVEDGFSRLTLTVPKHYARLADWGLEEKGQLLSIFSESRSNEKDAIVLEKTYRGDRVKSASLRIMIAESNETKTLQFDFKDIELP